MSDSTKPSLEGLRIPRNAEEEESHPGFPWGKTAVTLMVIGLVGFLFLRNRMPEVKTTVVREVDQSGPRTLLNASGYVTARRAATVSSKVTGKVVEVLIEEGMKIEAGQVLARLDDTNIRTSLALSEAQLAAGRAGLAETEVRLTEAKKELARIQQLITAGIATQTDLDRAEADAQSLAARLEKQKADIVVLEREFAQWVQLGDDLIIRAPFAGVVTFKSAQPGEMISPVSAGGGFTRTGICTIVDMSSLETEVDVNESYINRVHTGQPVEATLDAYLDWKIPAKVIAIIPSADRQKSTVRVRVGFDQLDPRILPEMGVKVAFREMAGTGTPTKALVVPRSSIVKSDGKEALWVMKESTVQKRIVTTHPGKGEEVIVEGAVAAGDPVVLNPSPALKEGGRARVSNR